MALARRLNYLNHDDINGAIFVPNATGEVETEDAELLLFCPNPLSYAPAVTFPFPEYYNANPVSGDIYLEDLYQVNYVKIMNALPELRVDDRPRIAAHVAYMRVLLIKFGIVNPNIGAAAKNCRYNLAVTLDRHVLAYLTTDWQASVVACVAGYVNLDTGVAIAANPAPDSNDVLAHWDMIHHPVGAPVAGKVPDTYIPIVSLDQADTQLITARFTDLICLCAYIFRVRGHHWQEDFDETLDRIWKGTSMSRDRPNIGIPWKYIMRHAFKSIYPVDLDRFWQEAKTNGQCSGNLTIRFNSPAAGTAAFATIRKGYDDLITAFPNLKVRFAEQLAVIENAEGELLVHRWAGSINRNFYNAPQLTALEGGLAPLAATLQAVMGEIDNTCDLYQSKSMKRVGRSALITGHVVSRVISTVMDAPEMAIAYLPEIKPVQQAIR